MNFVHHTCSKGNINRTSSNKRGIYPERLIEMLERIKSHRNDRKLRNVK